MRVIFITSFLVAAAAHAEVPTWYERDIFTVVQSSSAVVIYQLNSVELSKQAGPNFIYRLNTSTVEVLKGEPPTKNCYWVQSEGESDFSSKIGEQRIAIIALFSNSECATIESGYGAPGTPEYIELFREIIGSGT